MSGEYPKGERSGLFACRVKLHQHFLELGTKCCSFPYLIIGVMHPMESDVPCPHHPLHSQGSLLPLPPIVSSPDSTTPLQVPCYQRKQHIESS